MADGQDEGMAGARGEPIRDEDVLPLRMASLLLAASEARSEARTPAAIATWFGAMQAQDLASGQWSFGVRMDGATVADVEQAVVDREVLRTWPMRGTVHFVPAVDARWMLQTTGVRALAGAARRREHLGLTEAVVEKAVAVLRDALGGGRRLTRAACVELLVHAGVHTASQHGYHLLWYASQVGVTCMGPQEGKEQTFVLLDEWVPDPVVLARDAALAELAVRYFRSHGPTTVKDFAGWTGLPMGDARAGIAGAGDALASGTVDGTDVWFRAGLPDEAAPLLAERPDDRVLLVPGFDEFLLGYKDRSRMLDARHAGRIIPGGNGIFRPTIVSAGRVVGTWRRTVKKATVDIVPEPFDRLTKAQRAGFEVAARDYARFLDREATFPREER